GLMIVPGDRIDVGFYNDALFRSGRGLMPARIVAPGFRTEQGECFLSPTAGDHPVLSVFADRSHGDLSQVRFKRTLLLDPPASTATAVCAFSTGRPAIVEKAFGKGRVMLMAAGLGRDWADFVWKPTFLVFIRRATDYLMRRESESLNLSVYETATRFEPSASAATKLTVATPGGEMDQPIAESAVGGMRIQYGAISRPGIYRLMADQQPLGQFAANVDVRESDIGLPPMGLAGTPIRRVGVADVASVREPSQSGAELWMFCLKAALAVMILEALFLLAIEWRQKQAGKAGRRSA
ncbi:hypothetical protein FJY63_10930, partial [Candidatus Sumerlaeota bacterium]|nr:hypothetical protein [Candidatus Sumerlaeota bacterium]